MTVELKRKSRQSWYPFEAFPIIGALYSLKLKLKAVSNGIGKLYASISISIGCALRFIRHQHWCFNARTTRMYYLQGLAPRLWCMGTLSSPWRFAAGLIFCVDVLNSILPCCWVEGEQNLFLLMIFSTYFLSSSQAQLYRETLLATWLLHCLCVITYRRVRPDSKDVHTAQDIVAYELVAPDIQHEHYDQLTYHLLRGACYISDLPLYIFLR